MAEAGSSSQHLIISYLVFDQPAAAVGEDWRAAGKACAVLLADAGGRIPDESTVLGDAAQNCAVADSGKLADRLQRRESESRRARED
jgi:hypothetical protein